MRVELIGRAAALNLATWCTNWEDLILRIAIVLELSAPNFSERSFSRTLWLYGVINWRNQFIDSSQFQRTSRK